MDALMLSRWQFAVTTSYHFLFVPLSIGIGLMVAIMETLYVVRKDDLYLRMAQFWAKFLLISVALGVVTGIVLEFQFGLNWARFSRYIGDIFGPPLAIESWAAFFLESVFIGVWVFGGKKISPKLHAFALWMVTLGAMLSAFWILTANAFMQEPVGYALRNGRIELVDFPAVVFNPQTILEFWHAVYACITTSAFFVIAVSAYHLLKKTTEAEFFRRSMRMAVFLGLVGIMGVVLSGHEMAKHVAFAQPMKLAASEAVWDKTTTGSESVFALIDERGKKNTLDIRIPYLLNFFIYMKPTGTVAGINDLQKEFEAKYGTGNYTPPLNLTYWSFHLMIMSGLLMMFILFWLMLATRKPLVFSPFMLKVLMGSAILPHISNITGWIMTEVGRQPWIVYTLMKTNEGLTENLNPAYALSSFILFVLVYTILIFIAASLTLRIIIAGPLESGNR
ncbi:MAG: cytochrome ubiquinol oxidase subunit I [Candidatus Omnitrophica bacterium]|nr:cytochrome ubiquinol oxidase subunit I [Candidatus Omnitrophota bacterium]